MKIIKISQMLLLGTALITVNHRNMATSQDLAAKDYIYKNLDSIPRFQMFTRDPVAGNTVFEKAYPFIEEKMPNQDVFNELVTTNSLISYHGKQEFIKQHKTALLASITGFISAVRNEFKFFHVLMPGILAAQKEELANPSDVLETQDWKPELPKALSISNKDIEWAEQELIIELDFFITEFAKINNLKLQPPAHTFNIWIQGLDGWWKKEEFEKLITKFVNPMTKDRKALPILLFSDKSILFFLSSYIPKKLLVKDPTITTTTWDLLQKEFPNFAMYENKNLFNLAGDITRTHNKSFIVRMINENLKKIRQDNPLIGQIAEEKETSKSKKSNSLITLFKGS